MNPKAQKYLSTIHLKNSPLTPLSFAEVNLVFKKIGREIKRYNKIYYL